MTNVLTNTIDILIDKEDIEEVYKGLRQFKGTFYIKRGAEGEDYGEVFFCAISLEELAKVENFLADFV